MKCFLKIKMKNKHGGIRILQKKDSAWVRFFKFIKSIFFGSLSVF
jgi:hypothetical protein